MRIWVDGCFDFFHHGHAGALNQARALGDVLVVGIHTDAEIERHKGPVVMHLDERVYAVDACRWTSQEVSGAPYITDPKVMDEYDCEYVAHGDDITTDEHGNDTYQTVKDQGRFLEFRRTPNISTTDLIGRMLSKSTRHHAEADEAFLRSEDAQQRFVMYARGADAKSPHCGVFFAPPHAKALEEFVAPSWATPQNVFYVEGSFDLFHCGHIEFLEKVKEEASAVNCPLVVGLRSDKSVNELRGDGLPIMNVFERALCVLQCKHVDAVVLNVPYSADSAALASLLLSRGLSVKHVARGAKQHRPEDGVARAAQDKGELLTVPPGKYGSLRTQTIIDRVLQNRAAYEERQRKKGVKSEHEKEMRGA